MSGGSNGVASRLVGQRRAAPVGRSAVRCDIFKRGDVGQSAVLVHHDEVVTAVDLPEVCVNLLERARGFLMWTEGLRWMGWQRFDTLVARFCRVGDVVIHSWPIKREAGSLAELGFSLVHLK